MTKCLLFALGLLLSFTHLFAQETFQKSVGGTGNDYATSMAQTTDGGFILAGDTYSFGLSKSDMYIVKFDNHGNLLWNKRFGGTDYDHANCVAATKDGGCVVGGVSGGNNSSLVMLKINAAGNLEWSKFYSANTRHDAHAIAQTPEGGYVLAGSASTYNNGSWGYVVKTDSAGNLEWSKFVFDRSFYPAVQQLVVTKDSGYAVVVNQKTTNGYYDIFLIKLNKAGNFTWAKSIGDESTDFPSDLVQTSDGGYAVAGSTFDLNSNPQYSFMYVFKTDSVGNFRFAKRIKGTNTDVCRTITETNDKQLLISGSIPSPSGTAKNIFATKIDTTGSVLWTKILTDDVTSSEALDIVNTSDSGYAAAGFIGNSGKQDFLLARFDTGANICGATLGMGSDSDFGKPATRVVNVTNANTTVSVTPYALIDADGIYASICDVLPVTLISFTATEKDNAVRLEWVTAGEINTRSFELYRSSDGINYKLITTVAAHGSQAASTQYSFEDDQPSAGNNFYKLKSVDRDGTYSFSEVRTIALSKILIKIFPNPVKDWMNVELNGVAGSTQLNIYSAEGKLVLKKSATAQSGSIKQVLDIRNLTAGTYILQILTGDSKTQRLFIKK